MTGALTLATLLAVGVLVWAEGRDSPLRFVAKPAASAGFIAAAVAGDASATTYGRWVLAALALSALGDVALLSQARGPFLAGLVAFLAAHVAYSGGFVARGVAVGAGAAGAIVLAAVVAVVIRWLLPSVPADMKVPVIAYAAVISAMVALAIATAGHDASVLIPTGAAAFFLSDLAVARDRFVAPGFGSRLWGLPLYYLAQLALAWSAI